MEEEKPEEGSRAASLAAMLKGFLPKLSVEDFPVEPEKACQKLPVLLPLWLKEKVTKPEARTALRLAPPRIGTESREEILNHSGSYRKFLVKKKSNMKTGEKTDPHVLHVLKQMQHGMASGSKPEMAVKALQPAKRLRVKTPQKEACQQPGMAESFGKASSSKPKILIAVCDGSAASDGNSASGGSVANDGSAASDGSAAIAASSDVDFLEISSTSEDEITAEELKKPEMAQKKPAACKQAKAKGSLEKPSVMMAHHNSWVASCSFGLVKETKASSKAYIQARNGPTDKPYCLVNVSLPKGAEQSQVMAELMEEACKAGWTKDKLVEFKNSLLKRLG